MAERRPSTTRASGEWLRCNGDGWRQGSIIEVDLPLDAIVLGDSGRPERASTDHGVWVVVTQDCDLDRAERDAPVPVVELRPVFTEGCPSDWGIRSAKLRLTEVEYVEAASRLPPRKARVTYFCRLVSGSIPAYARSSRRCHACADVPASRLPRGWLLPAFSSRSGPNSSAQ